ncbi:hypothetical protein [Vibrio sonorensis]|uniref:hypothetical protein n=1 Tax=Vibrio sonorensis TaxID=1004316 RepID=UPI0008DB2330|nr:hypothetical protein [Vibrio sonorensis]
MKVFQRLFDKKIDFTPLYGTWYDMVKLSYGGERMTRSVFHKNGEIEVFIKQRYPDGDEHYFGQVGTWSVKNSQLIVNVVDQSDSQHVHVYQVSSLSETTCTYTLINEDVKQTKQLADSTLNAIWNTFLLDKTMPEMPRDYRKAKVGEMTSANG